TQGFLTFDGGGYEQNGFAGGRYGGKIGDDTYYRAYVIHQEYEGLQLQGDGHEDDMELTQGGFRIDSRFHPDDTITLQGHFYGGSAEQLTMGDITMDGQNVLGRWTHEFDKESSLMLQAYWDRTHRLSPGVFEEERNTFDMEVQDSLRYGEHYIVFGGNYRLA